MIRFQCPHCRGIVASDKWEAGAAAVCAYCSKAAVMPQNRLDAGMVIGDFLLIRKLGEGGMGIVFLAHQLSLDRPAAIKILNAEFSQQADSVQAFIREARSAAKLNHPNIVQAYAVGEDEGIFYFAMEYIEGKTMKAVLQENKKIGFRQAAEITLQVAEALDCAWNEQKLIHHDIKPDNIMQCANGRVKLADLGLAGKLGEDGNDDSDEVVGTPQYISPEQLTGVVTDTRSDIYSLGATIYHFVTGQFPYNGENTDEIARQHVFGTLVPPKNVNPELPQALNDIIVRMMAKMPGDRYQNCADLANDLRNFLNNDGKNTNTGGLTGSAAAHTGSTLKLGGGLSGGGAQPKMIVPTGGSKLSIKIGGKKEEKAPETPKAETPAPAAAPTAAETPAPAAKPSIKLAVKKAPETEQESSLNLAMNKPAAAVNPPQESVPSAETEAAAAEAVETVEAAPEESKPAAKAGIKLNAKKAAVETPAPEVKAEEKTEEAADKKAEESAGKTEEKAPGKTEETPAADSENKDAANENAENDNAESKSKSGSVWLVIVIAAVVLAMAGGGVWYYLNYMRGKSAGKEEQTANVPVVKFELPPAQETAEADEPSAPAYTGSVYKPQAKPKAPVLSAFMTEARKLEALYLSNEASFVQSWKQRAGKLAPKTAEEKKLYELLDENYVAADERLTVEPARKALTDAYNKLLANVKRTAEVRAFQKRIVEAEKKALELSEASAENYTADLPRKMGLLDYAMINAARTRRPADWQNFQKALEIAKNEPKRVAEREGFDKAAKALAEYAERLAFVAEQGKNFTELLEKNKFKNKKIEGKNSAATVVSTNRTLAVFSVVTYPKVEAPKPAPKAKAKAPAPAKGKKPAPKPKPKPAAKPKPVKPTVHKIALMLKKPEDAAEVKAWVDLLERDMGRRDQYFYYMLYNGYLQHSIASIAPDKFWKKRVDKVMRGYFDRLVFVANDAQMAALKKAYGTWASFQESLKEFQNKQ